MSDKQLPASEVNDYYHLVMIFQRKKDIPTLQKSSMCIFQDCLRMSKIKKKREFYQKIADDNNARAYVSVNPVDMKLARTDMIIRSVETLASENHDASLIAQTVSSMMKSPVKSEKRFLVDIDTLDKEVIFGIEAILQSHCGIDYTKFRSKKGWHIIVKPFDVRVMEEFPDVEVKRNAQTVLEYLDMFNIDGSRRLE